MLLVIVIKKFSKLSKNIKRISSTWNLLHYYLKLQENLRAYKDFQAKNIKKIDDKWIDIRGIIIFGIFGKVSFTTNFKSRCFIPILKPLNWDHITFHGLCHTHATILLSQKINPKIVQERWGHVSIILTFGFGT